MPCSQTMDRNSIIYVLAGQDHYSLQEKKKLAWLQYESSPTQFVILSEALQRRITYKPKFKNG